MDEVVDLPIFDAMQSARKVRLLLAGCFLIVIVLSGIQLYLVRNTYELTKKQYYAEVKQELDQLSPPFTDSAHSRAMRALQNNLSFYAAGTERHTFLDTITSTITTGKQQTDSDLRKLLKKNTLLSDVKFNMNYRQIILVRNGISDTILKATDDPLTILGDNSKTKDRLFVGAGNQVTSLAKAENADTGSSPGNRLEVKYEQSADVSGWRQQVGKRMTGVFLLAAGLIIALIFLFYQVFRTLLKQKRIAEITTDFANNMTHELKTPLSSIAIIIKSLEKESIRCQPGMADELVHSLARQHSKLQQLTDQVLEAALTEESAPETQAVRMPEFLQQVMQDFRNDTHRIEINIDPAHQTLNTDPQLLGSVIDNLLDNATKYSDPGTTVLLKAYTSTPHYIIEVHDQGKGIAGAEQARIFEKFYRVPEKDLHSVKGMGLGLYLCRVRISILGGTLSVRSRPGEGSTFIIKLPLREN